MFSGCNNLANISIGGGVISIGGEAFADCTSLTSIVIPDSVRSLEHKWSGAFTGCRSLRNVDLGKGLTMIGPDSFYGCTSLSEIAIPDDLLGDKPPCRCRSDC